MFKSKLLYVVVCLSIVVGASLSLSTPLTQAHPPLQGGASISVDKTQYALGEEVRWCYSVPRPAYVDITVFLEDGSSRQILAGDDDGRGDCLTGTIGPPTGRRRLVLTVSSGGRVIATAETNYRVVDSQSSPPPPPPPPTQEPPDQGGGIEELPESQFLPFTVVIPGDRVYIWTDRTDYRVGDTITFC